MDESDDEIYDSYEMMEDEQNFYRSDNPKPRSFDLHSTPIDMLAGRVKVNENKVKYNIDSQPQIVYDAGDFARARPSTKLVKPHTSKQFRYGPVRQNNRGHSVM